MSAADRTIEWGVLWDETGEVEPVESRTAADRLSSLYAWDGHVVRRVVSYGEWTEAFE